MDLTKQPKLIEINRDNLRVIDLVQSRIDGLNEECVLTYVESLKSGDEFPVIQILQSDLEEDGYFLIDGFHRVQAMDFITRDQNNYRLSAQLLGVGNLSDAIFLGTAANKTNGLQRTNADKRNAVKKLLELDIGKTLSNREIARHCGVSDIFVGKIRANLSANVCRCADDGDDQNLSANVCGCADDKQIRTVTRNGKSYQQNVTNIGRKQDNRKRCSDCKNFNSDFNVRGYGLCQLRNEPMLINCVCCESFEESIDFDVAIETTSDRPISLFDKRENNGEFENIELKEVSAEPDNATSDNVVDESFLSAIEEHWRAIEKIIRDSGCSLSYDQEDKTFYISDATGEIGKIKTGII